MRTATLTRRGHANIAFIAGAVVAGTLAATAVVIGPARLGAGTGPAEAAPTPEHRRTADLLAELLRGSHAVLAVHPRDEARRFAEIVLWLGDGEATAGVVDADEVGLLWHSRVSRTLALTTLPAAVAERDLPPPVRTAIGGDASALAGTAFAAALRTADAATTVVIARDLSDLDIAWAPSGPGADRLRIGLTWPAETVDGPDEASIVVDVRRPRREPKE